MPSNLQQLVFEIRKLFNISPNQAAQTIETYLTEEFYGFSFNDKILAIEELLKEIKTDTQKAVNSEPMNMDQEVMERIVPLILGRSASTLPADVLPEKLAYSINTVFDSLNQLVKLINATLGSSNEGDETIRHIIGSSMEGVASDKTLEEHIGQIKNAFLVTQQAFKESAKSVLSNVLAVLNPQQMEPAQTGLKIGPLKKAESFEIYEEKYGKCKKWFDSGRFMEDLLRQFEKNCRKLYSDTRG